jgi:hypothetical protein
MSGTTYTGSGEALVVKSNCNKLVPFTSSYKYIYVGSFSLYRIEYNNSFIGSRTLSALYDSDNDKEISSNGSLNFNAEYFYDSVTDAFYMYLNITGEYKKCNYASSELDYYIPSSSAASVKVNKKSDSSEDFHKLLDSNPNLKKKYLQIKAKLGK